MTYPIASTIQNCLVWINGNHRLVLESFGCGYVWFTGCTEVEFPASVAVTTALAPAALLAIGSGTPIVGYLVTVYWPVLRLPEVDLSNCGWSRAV